LVRRATMPNEAAMDGESEHGAGLAPLCNNRDLRHGWRRGCCGVMQAP